MDAFPAQPTGRSVPLCFHQVAECVLLNSRLFATPFLSRFGNTHDTIKFSCEINGAHHMVEILFGCCADVSGLVGHSVFFLFN